MSLIFIIGDWFSPSFLAWSVWIEVVNSSKSFWHYIWVTWQLWQREKILPIFHSMEFFGGNFLLHSSSQRRVQWYEVERFLLRTDILDECQNYLKTGTHLGVANPNPNPNQNTNANLNPQLAPSVHLKIKIVVTVRRGISKRSHEKIGDCEQS